MSLSHFLYKLYIRGSFSPLFFLVTIDQSGHMNSMPKICFVKYQTFILILLSEKHQHLTNHIALVSVGLKFKLFSMIFLHIFMFSVKSVEMAF